MTDAELEKAWAQVDAEFRDLLSTTNDTGHEFDEEGGEDALDKFFHTSALEAAGVNVQELEAQVAPIHTRINEHYRKLAHEAPPAEVTCDNQLSKLARRLAPQTSGSTRVEIEVSENGGRVEKTFGPKGDLIRIRILEEGDA